MLRKMGMSGILGLGLLMAAGTAKATRVAREATGGLGAT